MAYSITPASVLVNEGAGTLTFTITRTAASLAETLYVSTAPDLGYANTGDYTGLLNQRLSFAVGETSRKVTIAIANDSVFEAAETFGIILQKNASDPASVYLAKSQFTIQDDDPPPATTYTIAPGAVTASEAAGAVSFQITRSAAATAETVFVSTAPDLGYANRGDYAGLLNQALNFGVGQLSRTVSIALANDTSVEVNESFGLIVQRLASDPANVYLAKSMFTIADDDGAVPFKRPVVLSTYPATGIDAIGQGQRDNDDSHGPDGPRQWAYDFLTPNLTDVHAVAGGVVVAVRHDLTGAFSGFGNVVTIFHDGGFYASYGHLSAFSATVSKNMRVEAGQVIAKSGDSGSLDGGALHPNLHVQFGSAATYQRAKIDDGSTGTFIADGSVDAAAPAYFPKLTIDFSQRIDPGLSTDTDYDGTLGVDVFTGNGIGNGVFGNSGNDIIDGRGGGDVLRGGAGADTLTGGTGSDRFVYRALGEGGDRIADFSVIDDYFQFTGSVFGVTSLGVLAASRFRAHATNAALDADDRFIFRTTDTTLWHDRDGSGAAATRLIADLQAGVVMSNADILII